MPNSTKRVAGDLASESDMNELFDDCLHITTGHSHGGGTDEAVSVFIAPALVATRPAATGNTGRWFKATNVGTEHLSRSNGISWVNIAPVDPAAAIAGLRTLGTGALQISVGNHGH